jgi:hypothetical protein
VLIFGEMTKDIDKCGIELRACKLVGNRHLPTDDVPPQKCIHDDGLIEDLHATIALFPRVLDQPDDVSKNSQSAP